MTSKALYGLISLTSALLIVANIALQEYLSAAITFISGTIWLLLQIRTKESPDSIFFVVFVFMTLLGSLRGVPVPFMLLALSANLAAWDLSRFRARISQEEESASNKLLQVKHYQKLAVTLIVGFVVALLPTFIHFSLNFILFLCVFLLLMLTLRKSILNLRRESNINR